MNDDNQIIYIPAYVEEGVDLLSSIKRDLEDIEDDINSGLKKINNSGYTGEIPYINKGEEVATATAAMQDTIKVITSELKKYSRGKYILPSDAIIVANADTISKYRLKNYNVTYSLDEYKQLNVVKPKWSSNYLLAAAGTNCYYGADGRYVKETWCDLDPTSLVGYMKKEGIDLDFWIRDDGVYMYGDYVMVAADIPHMDGTQQEAEYRKGDLVETSLGTGMVVDLCGMAESVRKGEFAGGKFADVDVWYDIYTAWNVNGTYNHLGNCTDPNCTNAAHNTPNVLLKPKTDGSTWQPNALSTPRVAALEKGLAQTAKATTPPTTSPATIVPLTTTPSYNPSYPTTPSATPVNNPNYYPSNPTSAPTTPRLNPTTPPTTPITTPAPITTTNPTAPTSAPINYPASNPYRTNPTTAPITEPITTPETTAPITTTPTTSIEDDPTVTPIPAPVGVSQYKSKFNAVPILAGLGLLTAAGVGTKVYLDNKKNNTIEDNKETENYDEFEELGTKDSDFYYSDDEEEDEVEDEGDYITPYKS